jgi:hypothetical protein
MKMSFQQAAVGFNQVGERPVLGVNGLATPAKLVSCHKE